MNSNNSPAPRSRYAGVTSVDFRLVTDDEDPDVPNVLRGIFKPTAEPALPEIAVYIAPGNNLRGLADFHGFDKDPVGLCKKRKPVKLGFKRTDLAKLFAIDSTRDSHVCVYAIEDTAGNLLHEQPRLTKPVLDQLLAAGWVVNCRSVWLDLDLKDLVGRNGKLEFPKLKWVELTADEHVRVEARIVVARDRLKAKGMPWIASYNTESGFRFLHALTVPVPAGAPYEALVARFLAAYTGAGLPVDEACKDWTRLFRAPRVTKENGQTTWDQEYTRQEVAHYEGDDSYFYMPTDADLVPPTVAPTVGIERTAGRKAPDPIEAQQLVETVNDAGKWTLTPAGLAAKNALRDSSVFPWIFEKAPLAFPGDRHKKLASAVGLVVATLHGMNGVSPEFVFGLLYEPVGRLGEDEDWTGKLWEQATSFWDNDTLKKAQAAASAPSVPAQDPAAGPVVLSEPQGMNAAEWLAYMNQQHAVVGDFGGKCRVIGWRDEHGRSVLYHQSFEDVKKRYANRQVRFARPTEQNPDALDYKPVGGWWLANRERRQFERVLYAPGQPREFDGNLNLWKGWGVQPAAGDWSLMRNHVLDVLAAGNAAHADYILRWAAWTVQNPGRVAEVALVFRGGEGTGKGTFARAMKDLFGQHGVHVTSGLELTGRFNSHMRDCSLLFADEAVAPEDRDAVGRLKAMVTEPTIRVEQKGVDSQEFPNCLHVIMASNERWVVPAGEGDRRFVVFDVSEAHKEDRDWFDPLFAQLDAGGLAAMLHDLLAIDLGNWHPRQARPKTDAHAEQKAQSLRGLDRHWLDCLTSGELPAGTLLAGGDVKVSTSRLLDEFRKRDSGYGVNATNLGRLLFQAMRFEDKRPGGKARLAIIPPLAIARQRWDAARFPFTWPAADGWSIG